VSRRREFSEPAPGVVKVRLQGDTVGADVIAHILRAHPAIEVLTGPDRYDGGRQYLLVRVRMDGGLGQDRSAPRLSLADCASCGHPEGAHHVPGPDMLPRHCATPGCACPGWRSAAGMAMDAPEPRLLPDPACVCGHDVADHVGEAGAGNGGCQADGGCDCTGYRPAVTA
jgi:hypothetical protein